MPADAHAMDWLPGGRGGACDGFVASEFFVKDASEAWERHEAAALRRRVFCEEQQLFVIHDRDGLDAVAQTLVAVSLVSGMPEHVVGTVRIHEIEPGHWQGSRLAVQAEYRRIVGLGSALIRMAVGTARALGARRFTAQVQAQNVPLFERMHWRTLERLEVRGHPHHRMEVDLSRYAPCLGAIGVVAAMRKAA